MDAVAALRHALAEDGLDVQGVASAAAWDAAVPASRTTDALFPGTRSILCIGNGAGRLWDGFLADLAADPRGLTEQVDPLDAYVRRRVRAAEAALGDLPRRWFWAAADADLHIDFRLLAGLAGLGVQSRLGLLIQRERGMWIGLRAACFLPIELDVAPPVTDHPCDGCDAPCVTACPGGAFPDGRWSVDLCARFHQESATCERSCVSRLACPVGAERRYTPEQYAYHSHRESGRRWLRGRLGVTDDPFEGSGPYWGTWKARVDVKA
jgi:hypothetical protein